MSVGGVVHMNMHMKFNVSGFLNCTSYVMVVEKYAKSVQVH